MRISPRSCRPDRQASQRRGVHQWASGERVPARLYPSSVAERRLDPESFPRDPELHGHDHTIGLAALGDIADTALTREAEIKLSENGLPNTFLPGRNIAFLTFAAALAYRRGLRHIVGGMCETDYSGYPD